MLVKNEEHRWLRETLTEMKKVCDRIVVLDDGSTDRTPFICAEYGGAKVIHKSNSLWATNEVQRRKELWGLAQPEHGDWIVCLDADEILTDAEDLPKILKLIDLNYPDIGSVHLPLFDMWNSKHYRNDSYWTAHNRQWDIAVRYDQNKQYVWRETALHCGRFPLNAADKACGSNMKIKHMGWSTPEDRLTKYTRYMQADSDGKYGSLEQYKSILDEDPNLEEFV